MIVSSSAIKELAAAMAADDKPAVSRGQSFRGQRLQGADFSGEDLRGVDFTEADLRSATFHGARVGPNLWVGAAIVATAIAAAVGAGVLIGLAVAGTRERLMSGNLDEVVVAGVVIATLVVLVAMILWRGFGSAIKIASVVYVGLVAGTIIANLIWEDVEWEAVISATFVVLSLVLGIWAGVISHLTVGLFGRSALAGMTVLGALASVRSREASQASCWRPASLTSPTDWSAATFAMSSCWPWPIAWCADRELASSTQISPIAIFGGLT